MNYKKTTFECLIPTSLLLLLGF